MNRLKTAIIGGDERMVRLSRLMVRDGDCILCLNGDGTEDLDAAIKGRDAVILPVPCSFDGVFLNCAPRFKAPSLAELIKLTDRETVITGGKLTDEIKELCAAEGKICFDLLEDEALLIKNAQLTAEGALEITLRETDRAVLGARMLIVGFGRVGQALARILLAVGATVCVAARSEAQLALAASMGCSAVRLNEMQGAAREEWTVIYNTVPKVILLDVLPVFKNGTPFMELASGGFYVPWAEKAGLRFINAGGLPGKTAPESAALIIYERITHLLQR